MFSPATPLVRAPGSHDVSARTASYVVWRALYGMKVVQRNSFLNIRVHEQMLTNLATAFKIALDQYN